MKKTFSLYYHFTRNRMLNQYNFSCKPLQKPRFCVIFSKISYFLWEKYTFHHFILRILFYNKFPQNTTKNAPLFSFKEEKIELLTESDFSFVKHSLKTNRQTGKSPFYSPRKIVRMEAISALVTPTERRKFSVFSASVAPSNASKRSSIVKTFPPV